ncbi:MAG: hypothetical protein APR63_00510 [Desulfuromonas sp. SDB]|nr:MAG: hypothetical protein APR63_00510 [Desulfuromonas sp. SDB]
MKKYGILIFLIVFLFSTIPLNAFKYAVVVSASTYSDPSWGAVVDSLENKYSPDVQVFQWTSSIYNVKTDLENYQPDYIGFICQPVSEANEVFIRTAYIMTRELDSDPYGDAVWGIITGYNADDVIRSLQCSLSVMTTVSSSPTANPTNSPYRQFYQAIGTFEAEGGPHIKYSFSDGTILDTLDTLNLYTDRTVTFARWLNAESININLNGHPSFSGSFDMFVTSGHANVNEWQAHYPDPDPEGYFRSLDGQLRADTYDSGAIYINSNNPKVYLCPGNCLIGKPDNINYMVYAWFHTGGAIQMLAYMPVTWYGYQGWGAYSRFISFPGLFNVAESNYVTNQCLLFDLENHTPGVDTYGLAYDRDAVAIYGDPAQYAKMYEYPDTCWYYSQELVHIDADVDTFIFTIEANIDSVAPGTSKHPFALLPVRIDPASINVESTNAIIPVITDNFVLLYCWNNQMQKLAKGETRYVRWTATQVGVEEEIIAVNPDRIMLKITSANPFNNYLEINYEIPNHRFINLSIFDISGREVRNLVSGQVSPGNYHITWNGDDFQGSHVLPGKYFVVFKTEDQVLTEEIIKIK